MVCRPSTPTVDAGIVILVVVIHGGKWKFCCHSSGMVKF